MIHTALSRALAISLATVLTFGLVLLREATSPTGLGYYTAMAAAPNGDLYVADRDHQELRLVHAAGGWERLGPVPTGVFLALAADGANLMLGSDRDLFLSSDTGAHWRSVLRGRIAAVSIQGSEELAGSWAKGLYVSHDAGGTWAKASVPAGDTEIVAVIPGLAATLLGLLESQDGGSTWVRSTELPNRMTALDPVSREAGDWRGHIWTPSASVARVGLHWLQVQTVSGGVWSVAQDVIGTTQGIYVSGRPVEGLLKGREVTRVVLSGFNYWAATARGPIYVSGNGADWHLAYQG